MADTQNEKQKAIAKLVSISLRDNGGRQELADDVWDAAIEAAARRAQEHMERNIVHEAIPAAIRELAK